MRRVKNLGYTTRRIEAIVAYIAEQVQASTRRGSSGALQVFDCSVGSGPSSDGPVGDEAAQPFCRSIYKTVNCR